MKGAGPSPLLGFNNNFKHKGQVYHIQTEDSGLKHPHIITHLFADGGRILKSIKTSYASVVADPNYADIVRNMMKEQHKAMIIALRDGQFDPGGAREVKLPTTGPFAIANVSSPGGTRNQSGANAAVNVPAPADGPAVVVPTQSAPIAAPVDVAPPPPTPAVDVAALERAAAAAASRSPLLQAPNDLPPPAGASLGRDKPHGEYHQNVAPSRRASQRPPAAQPSKPPSGKQPAQGRYALTRPASIFATNKPAQGSIFGEDLISERSLDEVILGYLAEDLEGEKK